MDLDIHEDDQQVRKRKRRLLECSAKAQPKRKVRKLLREVPTHDEGLTTAMAEMPIARMFSSAHPEVLRLGTDFSGLETPSVALKRVGVPFTLEFACEKEDCLRKMLCELHGPKILHDDITTRRLDSVPEVDLYVSGFSCQPYSSEGRGLGEQDPDRGDHLGYALNYILAKRPRVVVMENVEGILRKRFEQTFKKALGLEIHVCTYLFHVLSFHGPF